MFYKRRKTTTKREQVEQMAKERNEIKDIMKLLDRCGSLNPMCKAEVATIIYGNNYRKIPEDSVVLTQDEWNDENHLAQRFGYDLGSKETAEKILNELNNLIKNNEDFGRGVFGWKTEEILMLLKIYADKQEVEIKE